MIGKHIDMTDFKVEPKIPGTELTKLRHDDKKPNEATVLKTGKHTITVIIRKEPKTKTDTNRLTKVGLVLPTTDRKEPAKKYFDSIVVTLVKKVFDKNEKGEKKEEVIVVPTDKKTVEKLEQLLERPHHYVMKVIVELKVVKDVKVSLKVKGCLERVPIPLTTTTTTTSKATPTLTKTTTSSKLTTTPRDLGCKSSNIIESPNLSRFTFIPNITRCEEKKIRYPLSKSNVGVHLICGSHSITIHVKHNASNVTTNVVSDIGIVFVGSNFSNLLREYVEYIEVFVTRFDLNNSLSTHAILSNFFALPVNSSFGSVYNILKSPLHDIQSIRFDLKLKRNVKIKFNVRACVSPFVQSLTQNAITSSFSPSINELSYRCTTLYNLLPFFQMVSSPKLTDSNKKRLMSVGNQSRSFIFESGPYSFEFQRANNETVSIVDFGISMIDEAQSRSIFGILKFLEVRATMLVRKYGVMVPRIMPINIPNYLTIRELRNVLSSALKNIVKISIKFDLIKNVKARMIIKGCHTFDTVTETPSQTTTPFEPKINEQSFRCMTSYSLLRNFQINSKPPLSAVDKTKLISAVNNTKNGISFSVSSHSFEFVLPIGQKVSIVEIGLHLLEKPLLMNAFELVESFDVTVTRLVRKYGQMIPRNKTISIPSKLSVKDLINVLQSGETNINSVSINFKLRKPVTAIFNVKGCTKFETITVASLTTLTPAVNEEFYNCQTKHNLLKIPDFVQISKQPPLPHVDNVKLRFSPNIGAPILPGSQHIKVILPNGKKATIVDLGINVIAESEAQLSDSLLKNLSVVVYRLKMSFGRLKSTPIIVPIKPKSNIGEIKNVLKSQMTNINEILIKFEATKKLALNVIVNGCLSRTVLQATTLPPVGCLHLNKYYAHGQIIAGQLSCDPKICSDGRTVAIFECNKKWTDWEKCSKFCGAGQTKRRQICIINPLITSVDKQVLLKNINETCLNRIEVKPCFERPCQDACKLTQWSEWSPCDNKSCKGEFQTRLRQTVTGDKNCTKPLMESRRCIKPKCPCAENEEVNSCANILCPSSCDHLHRRVRCVPSLKECVEACVCKLGYLYQNGKCVLRSNCFCLKPDFNTLVLNKPKTFDSKTKPDKKSGTGSEITKPARKAVTTIDKNKDYGVAKKPSKNELAKISKNDISDIKQQIDKTPPWGPGITAAPRLLASQPWYPGTTPYGVTIKLPTQPPKQLPAQKPSDGFKPAPPESQRQSTKRFMFVSTKRVFLQKMTAPKASGILPDKPLGPDFNKMSKSPSGSQVPVQKDDKGKPIDDQSSKKRDTPSGSPGSDKDASKTKTPGTDLSSNFVATHVVSNSTLIVNCQSCICMNGKLICTGPKCTAGQNIWSDWSTWSPCTAICGEGVRQRFRQCQGTNCQDKSIAESGSRKFMVADGIQSEEKKCMTTDCSCIYSRDLIKMHIGEEQLKKFKIDLGAVWRERDDSKGLSNNREIVKPGEILLSGVVIHTKCYKCTCKNGRLHCSFECK